MHEKDRLERAKIIFWNAVENWQQPAERMRYAEEQCGNDEQLRDQVRELLNAHDDMTDFMSEPAFAAVGVPTVERATADYLVGQQVGAYKILERLGEGGMGTVYVAEQTSPVRRQVALKIIKSGLGGKQVLARFEAEKQALALMDHPNVARVFDAGTTEHGTQFFVMELVRGVPITEFCDQQALPVAERLSLFQSVCQAVQHAHQKGIIHRDLKPSNVLVAMYNTTPVPKVIDFGIAKFAHGQRMGLHSLYTAFSQVLGTPLYMSPEQANLNAIDVDTRTDVYSLGVLLYELLTGTTPFDKETLLNAGLDEMRRIIREVEPMRPSKRISTLSMSKQTTVAAKRSVASPFRQLKLKGNELDWIVMKCLEKDRTRRYESASGLAEDVQRYLKDEPVVACPPSWGYRLNKTVRRNRAWLIPACLILAILVVSTAVSADQALRAKRAGAIANVNFANAKAESERARQGLNIALESIDQIVNAIVTDVFKELPQVNDSQGKLLTDAAAGYSRIIDLFPDQADVYRKRAVVYFQLALYDQAEADYRRVLSLSADDHRTMLELAHINSSYKGNHAEALRLLDRAVALDPNNAAYQAEQAAVIARQDKLKALEMLDRIISQSPVYTAYRYRGDVYMSLGRYEDAISDARMAIKVRPDAQTGWTILGSALAKLGRYEEALEAYDGGIASRPQILWAYMLKGDLLMQLRRFLEASEMYASALKCVPEHRELHVKLAAALYAIGDLEKANFELSQADQAKSRRVRAVELGRCLKNLTKEGGGFGSIEARCLSYAVNDDASMEDRARAMNSIAWGIVETCGATSDALAYAQQLASTATELSPASWGIWNTLGVAQLRRRNFESAVESFKKSASLDYTGSNYNWLWTAIAYHEAGDDAKAVEYYRLARNRSQVDDGGRLEKEVRKLLSPVLENNHDGLRPTGALETDGPADDPPSPRSSS